MRGSNTKLLQYMEGSKTRFVIPVYQRNYEWKRENCEQLYQDLLDVARMHRSSHFFGSIVSAYHPNGRYAEYLVIDGQQRLTTVSLLMLAMYNLIRQGKVIPQNKTMAEELMEDYLVDKHQPKETCVKLKPVKGDRAAFDRLFDVDEVPATHSNLTANYLFFYNRIQKEEISIDELYTALFALEIINIELTQDDDPQRIFESLNATGLALSEGDKIRNFILMGLPAPQQEAFYERYWERIERLTGYSVSSFIRDYLSIKRQLIPAMDKVYPTFKAYVRDTGLGTEPLLKELLSYARWYETLLKGKTPDKQLNACIERLNRLETTVTRPFFLEILRLQASGVLSLADVREIFTTTESYLFRRTICDLPTNTLNKIFLMLHKEIIRYDGTTDDYVDKFKYALLAKGERARFPTDDEFSKALVERPIYKMNSKNKVYILERLENHGTIEDKDIYRHCDEGVYSIEHIMPQHLTPAWSKALGPDAEHIHETWLHRLANLTLTGYNSKYSNASFAEKRDMPDGFRDSGLRMNTWIAQQEDWGLSELEQRSRLLVQRALAIWKLPATSYVSSDKQLDACSLEDDIDLTGRLLARYSYKNAEQPTASWAQMMEQVLKMLHAEDASLLYRLANHRDAENELRSYISCNPKDLRNAMEIDAGIYVERNTSTATKIMVLRKLFQAFHTNPEDLVFYLRDTTNEELSEKDEGSRYKLRRRYWAYALPYIQQAHGGKAFSNCTRSKENWISGWFGISGFSINCVANYNMARVELWLSSSDKDKNKTAFDYLYGVKAQIEEQIGEKLIWRRLDDHKASVIAYALADVSIAHEADWTQMAKFHADWSKRFYDVLVPYLKDHYHRLEYPSV